MFDFMPRHNICHYVLCPRCLWHNFGDSTWISHHLSSFTSHLNSTPVQFICYTTKTQYSGIAKSNMAICHMPVSAFQFVLIWVIFCSLICHLGWTVIWHIHYQMQITLIRHMWHMCADLTRLPGTFGFGRHI